MKVRLLAHAARLVRPVAVAAIAALSLPAQAAPAQSLAAQAPAPQNAGAARSNEVELIVDDLIVTQSEVFGFYQRLASRYVVSTREEELQLLRSSQEQAARTALFSQAGDELGHPAEEIQARVRGLLDYHRQEEDSRQYKQYVAKANALGRSLPSVVRREMLREMWLGTVTGSFEGVGNRLWADNFVRPGQAHETYLSRRELLKRSGRVQFQRLMISAKSNGDLETAEAICRQLHADLLAGADFGEQVKRYGQSGDQATRGILEPQETGGLDPVLADFVLNAEIGSITGVLPAVNPQTGDQLGFQVLKVLDRVAPPPQRPFTNPEEQRELYRLIRERTLDNLVGQAAEKLQRDAYIRTPGQPPAIEPAEEPPALGP